MNHTPHPPDTDASKASPRALALALLVNALLIGALFLNLQWQQPKPAEVELWDGASLQAALDDPAIPEAVATESEVNESQTTPVEQSTEETAPAEIDTKKSDARAEKTSPQPKKKPESTTKPTPEKPKKPAENKPKSNNANQSSVLNSIKNGSGAASGEDTSGYKAAVKRQVENSARSLKGKSAVVFVSLTASGVIQSKRIAKTSGDAAWDAKLLSAIGSRLPPNVPKSLQSGFTLTIRP
ncbi:MAG: cell envelope integrity protein TolA [Formosimonas sp.]|jgi:colicin import membrane protein